MNKSLKALAIAGLSTVAVGANAAVLDFIALTEDPGGLGESAWETLAPTATASLGMTVTGHSTTDDDAQQYAYLDWNNAGLGMCKDAISTGANPGSGSNQCSPSSDDNVTVGEYLTFRFTTDVVIENLWFNNNHDGGFDPTDMVNIDGTDYSVAEGYVGGPNGIGSFFVAANTDFNVGYSNEEFYMSGMVVNAVSEASTALLFGAGLLSVFGLRRRQKA